MITAKIAEPAKITGELLIVTCVPTTVVPFKTIGVSHAPIPYPRRSPVGMPTTHKRNACCLIIRFNCRGVVPIVLSSP